MASFEDRFWTSADGLRLHYRDYSGPAGRPPILCLHGLTRNARDFADFADLYAGDWRVILPDFRGRGGSEWDPQPARYAPPTYAGDILQLMALLDIEKAVFVGTSLGGIVTMLAASVNPGLVAAAVLNDVGPVIEDAGLHRIAAYVGKPALFASWDEAADAILSAQGAAHPAYGYDDWLEAARRHCRDTCEGIVFDYDPRIADNFHAGRSAPAVDAWPFFDALAAAPLLVVRGETSDLLGAATAEAMVERHPDAELVTVPGVGHAPNLDEPEALAAVDRLLARVSS